MAINTTNTAASWSPDLTTFQAAEAIPEALILRASTVAATTLQGDAPVARVAWVNDAAARFAQEGSYLEEDTPDLAEVVVPTAKVTQLLKISREQWHQEQTGSQLSASTTRAITKKANDAFVSQPAPPSPDWLPLVGVANTPQVITQGPLVDNLDPLADALALVESNGGSPSLIIAHPMAWGALRNFKTSANDNTTLLGAGTADTEKRLFGMEVITTPAAPEDSLVVIDPTAIASAVGPLEVAQSEHQYFDEDSIALRATWRIGWAVQHPDRIAVVTVDDGTEA